jgi:membrane protein YdbS with pleckstrin-like domain
MDDVRRRAIWRRRLLRLWWGALVVWVIAVAISLTMFGGFSSPWSAISAVITLLVIVLGFVSVWMSGREDRSSP